MLFIMLDVTVVRTHWDVVWKFPLTEQINAKLKFLYRNIIILISKELSPPMIVTLQCQCSVFKIDSTQILCKLWLMTKNDKHLQDFSKRRRRLRWWRWWRLEVWWFILIWGQRSHWSHGGQCRLITCKDCVGEKERSRPANTGHFLPPLVPGFTSRHLYFGCWPLITSGAARPGQPSQ